ncbi:MAG: nucleoside-diphosphate kinase [Gammaproteobacteria bacterium]|nr:nucleoside-diphosphate kinase [Gammaproteobacteria bacterium]
MPLERTLSIIKPDAVGRNLIGAILARFEEAGLRICAAKLLRLTPERARAFYAVHRERPFFERLVNFMASGPVMVQVLEGRNAVLRNRDLMGATNPREAEPGTIRYDFARDMSEEEMHRNVVHGSDSVDNAGIEIDFFFRPDEIFHRSG